jgi:pimeloyl-ACP methyl ester carboxylesterase
VEPAKFDIRQVALEWYHGAFPAERTPDFAVWALQNGHDGPALRELAGLKSATRSNEGRLVERALLELGVQPMTSPEAAKLLILSVFEQIVSGRMLPGQGAARIVYGLSYSAGQPKEFLRLEGLLSEWEDLPHKSDNFEKQIIAYARSYLAKTAVEIPLDTIRFRNGSISLHAVAAGPQDGPVVVLLHGFPEFWYGWRRQIEPLAAAGFRVIVPDQRGYNLSSKPSGVAAYSLTELVSDVIAIADQLGQEKIFIAAHDWGAAVAWSAALLHPHRIAKLAVLNVPHPSVMRKFLSTRPRQLFRSWYMFFFQLPWLPEAVFSAFKYRISERALLRSSLPRTFTAEDLAQYRAAWSQPNALTGMINWYRALFRTHIKFPDKTVRVPTRILWGERDAFLMAEMAHESLRYCTNGELFTFATATHWLQHEEPARVSELLVDFFRS